MCRHAGAGREHSQAASPSWPKEIFYAIDIICSVYKWGWPGERNPFFHGFDLSHELELL